MPSILRRRQQDDSLDQTPVSNNWVSEAEESLVEMFDRSILLEAPIAKKEGGPALLHKSIENTAWQPSSCGKKTWSQRISKALNDISITNATSPTAINSPPNKRPLKETTLLRIVEVCRCNKSELAHIIECGMAYDNGRVVLCSTEGGDNARFYSIALAGCKHCEKEQTPLVDLLLDASITKWMPDAMELLRRAPIRAALLATTKPPSNFGCIRTLHALDPHHHGEEEKFSIRRVATNYEGLRKWMSNALPKGGPTRNITAIQAYLSVHLPKEMMLVEVESEKQLQLQRLYLSSGEVVARIELAGMEFNDQKRMIQYCLKEMENEEQRIHKLAGQRFDLTAHQETAKVLFKKLKLKVPEHAQYTSTRGHISTRAEVLEKIDHPIAPMIIKWRRLEKALESLRSLQESAATHPHPQRIRAAFDVVGVVSGRIPSSSPNLHNLPKGTIAGSNSVRDVLVAAKEMVLISADYKQLELRILCQFSGDGALRRMVEGSEDPFEAISRYFKQQGVTAHRGKDIPRDEAKALCYGIIYGMGGSTLSRQIDTTQQEADALIEKFFELFPKVKTWIDEVEVRCRDDKYCESFMGRRRAFRYASDESAAKLDRQAVNHIVQGTASELFRQALIDVEKAVNELSARIVMELYDDIIVEAPKERASECATLLKQCMEGAFSDRFSVPLPVVVKVGDSWGSMEKYCHQ